ncbi:type II toxin-antitoxin system Phd/YefM family antitoxin [Spirosoma arcticum]
MKMVQLHKVSAQEARVQLSDLINKAVYGQQPSVITRQGKPVAVLIAFEEWQVFQQWKQKEQSRLTDDHNELVSLLYEPFVSTDQSTNTEKVAESDQANLGATEYESPHPEENIAKETTN